MYKLLLAIIVIVTIIIIYLKSNERFNDDDVGIYAKPVRSYYTKYDNIDKIVVGYHYTKWSPACLTFNPIWDAVKNEVIKNPSLTNIIFMENDEGERRTEGILRYPTILKYVNGRCIRYKGFADYDQLRTWILDPVRYVDVPLEMPF
jgi:hypothetical protein